MDVVFERLLTTVAFSPDGHQFATAGQDTEVRLWNTATGEPQKRFRGNGSILARVRFNPREGQLAAAGPLGKIWIWDLRTGETLHTLPGHTGRILCLEFSPDGKHLATGGDDQTIRIWNAQTGEQLRALTGHRQGVADLAFSPDGTELASAGNGVADRREIGAPGEVKIWGLKSGQQKANFVGHLASLSGVGFHPDGTRLVTCGGRLTPHPPLDSRPGELKVWDVETGTVVLAVTDPDNDILRASFSRDGRHLLTAAGRPNFGGTVRIYSAPAPPPGR